MDGNKVTAARAHTHRRQLTVVKVSVMGLLDVRGCQEREVQKQEHGDFVPGAGQAVPRGHFGQLPGAWGEWGDCTFCTFLGKGMGIVMACCPGNDPGTWLS